MANAVHETNVITKFATWGSLLWNKWNTITPTPRGDSRRAQFRGYISALCGMANIYCVTTKFESGTDAGGFSRSAWKVYIDDSDFDDNRITLGNYVELCKTALHEVRHAEQYYRMAQALHLGLLEWPNKVNKKYIKVTGLTNIETRLGINHGAVQDAINNRQRYSGFSSTPSYGHCCKSKFPARPNDHWTYTVDDWLCRRYKTDQKKFGQMGLDSPATGVVNNQFYNNAALDYDCRELEKELENTMSLFWKSYNSLKNKKRNDPAFAVPARSVSLGNIGTRRGVVNS